MMNGEKMACWAIGMVLFGAIGAVGCGAGDGSSTEGASGNGGTGGSGGAGGDGGTGGSGGSGLVCPNDPADGVVAEECGVWVALGGDDGNPGTQAAPVKTLSHAIDLAAKGPGRVYACGETWQEALTVPSGVSLHGGFDCANGWAYTGDDARAMLLSTDSVGLTWVEGGSMEMAYLTEFYIEAADAVEPGTASIGAFIRGTLPLTIFRSEIVAGNGADGLDGAPGDENNLPAAKGAPGNNGANACSSMLSAGGAAVQNPCDGGGSKGGAGGDSTLTLAANGESGEPVSDPPAGAGGLGAQMAGSCTNGGAGAKGAAGNFGFGSKNRGVFTEDGFVGFFGEDGMPGLPGQGGGGGGAVLGSSTVCGAGASGGAAGGSGGAGGCGGKPGKGGQGGGPSIGLASISRIALDWDDTVFVRAGFGGAGGNGGAPQLGGAGGLPGNGGAGIGSIPSACAGGPGGVGGNGGYGGGGAGGSTVGVAISAGADNEIPIFGNNVLFGMPGPGGKGIPGFSEGNGFGGGWATFTGPQL